MEALPTPARKPLAERTSSYVRALRVPVLFIVVSLALLAAYYSLYVSGNAAYLTGRNLRLVANLARQIEASLADHETVLSSFSTYYGADQFRTGFPCIAQLASAFVPMFEYVSVEAPANTPITDADASCQKLQQFQRRDSIVQRSTPIPIAFTADFGMTWSRRVAEARAQNTMGPPFRFALRDVVSPPFRQQVEERVFDSLVLATTAGRIVHQEVGSDLRLTTLNRLLRKNVDGSWKELEFSTLPSTSQVLEVEMSGGRYLLYLQPCCMQFIEQGKPDGNAGLVVAGLVDAGAFRAESMAVSFSMMALMAAAILLAIFSWPFLKLALIGEGQRLRLIDVLLVGICSLLGTSLVTLFVVDWSSYGALKDEIDEQLETLSLRIRQNMREELTLALEQLRYLDAWVSETRKEEGSSIDYRTPDLFSLVSESGYPLLESFALIGADGMQARKWAVSSFTTPRVSTLRREYFRHWMGPHSSQPPYFLESIRSATTGRKEAVLSKVANPGSRLAVAALTLPMVSLTSAVLPPNFGFAVIDEQGQVLFHSDLRRGLAEQLFLETDRNRRLRAAVAARRAEIMNVRYFGRDHRAYVAPVEWPESSNWSVITFADKEPLRTVNIEWLVTTMLFAVIYVSLYVAICLVILVWRPSYRATWIWPVPARQPSYQKLIASDVLFATSFVAAIYSLRGGSLLVAAGVLPFIVWIATYLTLTERGAGQVRQAGLYGVGAAAAVALFWFLRGEPRGAATIAVLVALGFGLPGMGIRVPVRHAYVIAAMLLLLLTSVLPSLAFFKVAHAIQVESFIKYEQLHLARQLQTRAAEARLESERSASNGKSSEIVQQANTLRQKLSVYDQFFFDTRLCEPADAASVESASRVQDELPKPLEDLLPYYSETSVGMRELLHDRSSDNAWEWRRRNAQLVLYTPARPAEETLCLRSSLPALFVGRDDNERSLRGSVAKAALLACVILLVVYWVVRFVARRIFLIHVIEPLWAQIAAHLPMHPGSNLYILWRSDQRGARKVPSGGECVIDLASSPKDAKETAEWFVAQRDRLEQAPPGQAVVIDHIEERLHESDFNAGKLALINDALEVQHRTVVVVSALSRTSLLRRMGETTASGSEGGGLSAAWSAMLGHFTVIEGVSFKHPEEPLLLGSGLGPAASGTATVVPPQAVAAPAEDPVAAPGIAAITVTSSVRVEYADPVVRSVWAEVHRVVAEESWRAALDQEQLFEEAGDRLESYYQGLWSSCTASQKLVLRHLAQEGLVNEKDRRMIRVLTARGLIRKSPNFQFVDETFRRFVLSRSTEVAQLEPRSGSAWDDLRLPFFAALLATSAFFFLTQRELFTTTMAVITALAGGIPAIVRVVGLFDGTGSRVREG